MKDLRRKMSWSKEAFLEVERSCAMDLCIIKLKPYVAIPFKNSLVFAMMMMMMVILTLLHICLC